MLPNCRELTRMLASDELVEAGWSQRWRGPGTDSPAHVPALPTLRHAATRPWRRSPKAVGSGSQRRRKTRPAGNQNPGALSRRIRGVDFTEPWTGHHPPRS